MRTASHNVWDGVNYVCFANGKPCNEFFFSPFQSIHEYHIIAAALHDMRSSPTAPAEGVKMLLKPIPQTTFFVFYGCHTLSDGSQYEGQWVRTADDKPPHPTPSDKNSANGFNIVDFGLTRARNTKEICGSSDHRCAISGKMHGKGVMLYCNGDSYKGGWVEGRKSGKGVYT